MDSLSLIPHLNSSSPHTPSGENAPSQLCPTERLPQEILAKIFHSVPESIWRTDHMSALQNRRPYEDMIDVGSLRPLRLVCRYWNNVLLHTPNLWSTILDLPRDHSRPFSPTNRPVFSSYIRTHTLNEGFLLPLLESPPCFNIASPSVRDLHSALVVSSRTSM